MSEETLWAVNVTGPDDMHAMPSLIIACRAAHRINAWYQAKELHPNDPIIWANVIPWTGDAASHADDMQRLEDSILKPDERPQRQGFV